MSVRVVAISGAVGVGKSTVIEGLEGQFGALRISTRALIQAQFKRNPPRERKSLQRAGDRLDRETDGSWIATELGRRRETWGPDELVIVDSVRKANQIEALRKAFGPLAVFHIHLTASTGELERRYASRAGHGVEELPSYADVRRNSTEKNIERLAQIADVVIDTELSLAADVVTRAAGALGLFGPPRTQLVDTFVGGQYGSEGKGNVVAYLASEYDLLVRVGGPNAGHKVCFDWDKNYTHHHLPSGTLTSKAKLALAPGAVLRVPKLLQEIADCSVEAGRLWIDPQAMVISDDHVSQEADLVAKIGSTGQGVGAATAGRIMGRSTYAASGFLARDVRDLAPYIRPFADVMDDVYAKSQRVMLEGTQGTHLSIYHGSYPHVTSRDTTVAGCLAEAGIAPARLRKAVVVLRTYPIRVQDPDDGSSGHMGQQISLEEIAKRSGLPLAELEQTERTSTTNRKRRIAEFDWSLFRRTIALNGPTDIALTFADYLSAKNQAARRYDQLTSGTIMFIEELERIGRTPVSLISTRFHAKSIIDRRAW